MLCAKWCSGNAPARLLLYAAHPYPSARRLLDRGLHVALATDFNPGTSYCENMQTMISLAMSTMDMTLEEALTAATINGARALAWRIK